MNLIKGYLICMLSIPFATFVLGANEYFIQSEDYFPVLINGVFSIILIYNQKDKPVLPAFKWFAKCIGLVFCIGMIKWSFVNQLFFIESFIIYLLVLMLFLNHYKNKSFLVNEKLDLILIFIFFSTLHICVAFTFFFLGINNTMIKSFSSQITGVYYNPSFLLNTLLLFSPFLYLFINLRKSKNIKACILGWLCAISLILILILILYNKNRTGAIAIALLTGYNLYTHYQKTLNIKLLVTISILVFITSFWIYSNKINSTHGRFLITKITNTMIKENLLFGVGFNNYKSQYNSYQKEYFSEIRPLKEILLADNNKLANNEWLQLLAEIGIIGFFLLLFFLSKIIKTYTKPQNSKNVLIKLLIKCRNHFFLVVIVISLFSNPFRIPSILNLISILFLVYTVLIPFKKEQNNFIMPLVNKNNLILIAIILITPFIIQEYYLYKWLSHNNNNSKNQKENFNYFNNFLNDNENYLYTTSFELYRSGNYNNSIRQLEKLSKIKNDTQSAILLGLNYSKLKKHNLSLKHFENASLINPKLFRPKYLMMHEFLLKGDTIAAVNQAKIIVNFPVKIPSKEIDFYKREASLISYFK